jgi:hypothetical protein
MLVLYLPEVCGNVETWQTRREKNNKIDKRIPKERRGGEGGGQWSRDGMKMM